MNPCPRKLSGSRKPFTDFTVFDPKFRSCSVECWREESNTFMFTTAQEFEGDWRNHQMGPIGAIAGKMNSTLDIFGLLRKNMNIVFASVRFIVR